MKPSDRRRSRLWILLLVAVLLVPATGVLAKKGGERGPPADAGKGHGAAGPQDAGASDANATSNGTATDPDDDVRGPPDHARNGGGNATTRGSGRAAAGDDEPLAPQSSDDGNETNATDDDAPGRSGDTPAAERRADKTSDDGDEDNATADEPSTDASPDEHRRGPPSDEERSGEGRGPPPGVFDGSLEQTATGFEGRFISFQTTDAGLSTYAVHGIAILDAVQFDPALDTGEFDDRGRTVELGDGDVRLRAVDAPAGHFDARAAGGTITLLLAAGHNATLLDDGRVLIEGPGGPALVGGDNLTIDGDEIVATDALRFAVGSPGLRADLAPRLAEAVTEGLVGAEIVVSADDDVPDAVSIAHGDLGITTEQAAGSVTITVEGHGNGTTLLFNIERDAIGRAEDLAIDFDGERIHAADDLSDVLDVDPDEPAEYILIVGRNSTQLLVSVPHFSVHTIHVQSLAVALPDVPPGSVPAFMAAVLGAAAFVGATWRARGPRR